MTSTKRAPKEGKLAIVSGGASGIGQAYAIRLAEDGADLIILDLLEASETEAAIAKTGRAVRTYRCDLTDPAAVDDTTHAIIDEYGGCDILVNNAGIGSSRPFEEIDYKRFRSTLAINLEAPFMLCRAFVPAMKERGWGRIVNVSSSLFNMTVPNIVDYVAAKGGVVGLTRALASDLGRFGITVNAIAPGLVRTPLTVTGREDHLPTPDEGFEAVRMMQTIPRGLVPQDMVGALSFLTSDDAEFMTGQVLHVDAGLVRA